MDIVGFAIWKFRTVEGVLLDMRPFDFNTTKHVSAIGDVTWIRYDYASEKATIESDDGKSSMQCSFYDLPDTLQKLGLYRIRPKHERHSCTEAPPRD